MNGQNRFGLLGKDLTHSFSSELHHNLSNINYDLFSMSEEEAKDFILSKDFKGINVTIPYKQLAFKCCDKIDKYALLTKTVNTIISKDNLLYGYNTDYLGFSFLLGYFKINVTGKKVLILGNGATSNTVFFVLQEKKCNEIVKLGRNNKNNAVLYSNINNYKDFDIIINTTPVGMFNNKDKSIISLANFNNLSCVIDVVYNPLYTDLLLQAKEKNIKYINGLMMLVAQGVYSNELFLNCKYDNSVIIKNYYHLLLKKINIVLIGMSFSGKTSVGKLLAEKLNKQYIDTDLLITTRCNMSIQDIFKEKGEVYFRSVESDEVLNLKYNTNCVISTGGGIILNKDNISSLQANSLIIYIKRDFFKDISFANRPLIKSEKDYLSLYQKRYELYEKYSNIMVENNTTIEECVEKIEGEVYEYLHNQWS